MANNREIAQLGSFISVHDTTGKVGLANSVGIGTTSPTADWTVDVHGDARVTGILSVGQSGGSQIGDDLVVRNIKATGIGTVDGKLDVGGIINSSTDVRINGSSVIDEAVAMAIALG